MNEYTILKDVVCDIKNIKRMERSKSVELSYAIKVKLLSA